MASSPIHKLSDDVLYEIFRNFVETHHRDAIAMDAKLELRRNGWIRGLTHVCKRWRAISFNAPLLWTNVVFGNPDETAAFLDRARGLSLSVSGRITYTADDELIRTTLGRVLDYSDQVATLNMLLPAVDPPIFSTLGQRPFPKLAVLSLERTDEIMFRDHITFPPFFGAEDLFPHLRELRMRRYPMTAILRSGLPLHQLRKFEFMTHFHDPLPMDATLEALRSMPLLEELIVSGSITQQLETVTSPISLPKLVPLVSLRSLSLRSVARGASAFLVYLTLPPDATVKLNLTIEDYYLGDEDLEGNDAILPSIVSPIIDISTSAAALDPSQLITALAIHMGDDCASKFRVCAWASPSPFATLSAHEQTFLRNADAAASEPCLDVCMNGFSSTALLEHLCAALPLEHVQLLFVCSSGMHSGPAGISALNSWRLLFANTPGLLGLSVSTGTIDPLPTLLRTTVGDRGGHGQMLLPNLKQLSTVDDSDLLMLPEIRETWMKKLELSLSERRDSGCTIELTSGLTL